MTPEQFAHIISNSLSAQERFRSRWVPAEEDETLRVAPETITSVLTELEERLQDNYPFFHPRYAGQMLKPPHPVAVAAYLMAMQINPNNHALDGGPATATMELEVVRELAKMVGYGEHLGHLTSSGTIANLEALWVARQSHPGKGIACSPDAHYTHQRMCEVLKVPCTVTDVYSMERLENLFKSGTVGTLVVTIGTTGTGAVEPLDRILPLAKQYGIRIHADCAYGGFFALLARSSDPLIEPAPFLALSMCDSIVIDPHKHGLQPYGCGCVLFRDPAVGRFYKHDSPYTYFTSAALHLGEISLECSRAGAAAAALWATLKCLPLLPDQGIGAILRKTRQAALAMDSSLRSMNGWHVYTPPQLDIVTYFHLPAQRTASALSTHSHALFERSMQHNEHPLFLALMNVPSASVQRSAPDLNADAPMTAILRSVLMKPEHLHFVPVLTRELDQIASSLQ